MLKSTFKASANGGLRSWLRIPLQFVPGTCNGAPTFAQSNRKLSEQIQEFHAAEPLRSGSFKSYPCLRCAVLWLWVGLLSLLDPLSQAAHRLWLVVQLAIRKGRE